MVWARVQLQEGTDAGLTSHPLVFPGVPVQGNLLVAIVDVSDGTGLAGTNGFTVVGAFSATKNATTHRIACLAKVAGAGESQTVTITTTNATDFCGKIVEYSGNAISGNDVDGTSSWASGGASGGGAYSNLPGDPTNQGDLVILGFGWDAAGAGVINGFVGHGGETQIGGQLDRTNTHLVAWERLGNDNSDQPFDGNFYGNGSVGQAGVAHFKPLVPNLSRPLATGSGSGTIVQTATSVGGAGSTRQPVFGGGPTAGDVMVAFVTGQNTGDPAVTITPPAGWTQWGTYERFTDNAGSTVYLTTAIFQKVAQPGEPTNPLFTFSSAQTASIAILAEVGVIRALDLTPQFHSHVLGAGNGDALMLSGTRRSLSRLVSNDLVFAYTARIVTLGPLQPTVINNGFALQAAAATGQPVEGYLYTRTTNTRGVMSAQVGEATPGVGQGIGFMTWALASLGVGENRQKGRPYWRKNAPPVGSPAP